MQRISLPGAVRLCALLVFDRSRFIQEAHADLARRQGIEPAALRLDPYRAQQTDRIRKELWRSFVLVLCALACGIVLAFLFAALQPQPRPFVCALTQILGAAVLLWGTLAVRGGDIATLEADSLPERVNQWIYRTLYFIGTALITLGTAWPVLAG
ncbi:MAG: hypothetical protein KGJ85_05565 [Betaproteobacteria bacterium]|nr:hypothetical protein [Betaproteobacteria bacterium]MDE2151781.1 hypothetical protein [Betaproteobacteria bacterium]